MNEKSNTRRVFTYKDIEEAKAWFGKRGLFFDNLHDIENEEDCSKGFLYKISSNDLAYPFGKKDTCTFWQFFSPDFKPEIKYIPFTAEDWQFVHLKAVRMKTWNENCFSTITGWDGDCFEVSDNKPVSPDELLEHWMFMDSSPCGKMEDSNC